MHRLPDEIPATYPPVSQGFPAGLFVSNSIFHHTGKRKKKTTKKVKKRFLALRETQNNGSETGLLCQNLSIIHKSPKVSRIMG